MIGWAELESDIEMLRDVALRVRLEAVRLEVTVENEKKLRELAWLCVSEGFAVNLHSTTSITIVDRKKPERVVHAKVRA